VTKTILVLNSGSSSIKFQLVCRDRRPSIARNSQLILPVETSPPMPSSPRSLIIVFTHELVAGTPGEGLDGLALALVASAPTLVDELVRKYATAGVLFFFATVPVR